MTEHPGVEEGRLAFEARAWADACSLLSSALAEGATEPEDLELLAFAASLAGEPAPGLDEAKRLLA